MFTQLRKSATVTEKVKPRYSRQIYRWMAQRFFLWFGCSEESLHGTGLFLRRINIFPNYEGILEDRL